VEWAGLTNEEILKVIDQLRNGEVKELFIDNNDFLNFRSLLVIQDDFKNFHGTAQRGGNVLYRYIETL
jgi:hypothetical protein